MEYINGRGSGVQAAAPIIHFLSLFRNNVSDAIRLYNQNKRIMNMSDKFEIEQQILNCWNVVDDIKMISEEITHQEMSTEQIKSTLRGLSELYQIKFDRLFRDYEQSLRRPHAFKSEQISETENALDDDNMSKTWTI